MARDATVEEAAAGGGEDFHECGEVSQQVVAGLSGLPAAVLQGDGVAEAIRVLLASISQHTALPPPFPATADDEEADLLDMCVDDDSYIGLGKMLELARGHESESDRKKGRVEAMQRYHNLCPMAKRAKQRG